MILIAGVVAIFMKPDREGLPSRMGGSRFHKSICCPEAIAAVPAWDWSEFMNEEIIAVEFGAEFADLWARVRGCTMASPERAYATFRACRYVSINEIAGDFAECGVYLGGMAMLAALTFEKYSKQTRSIFLFDTFAGMTPPTEVDSDRAGLSASSALDAQPDMCLGPLDEVMRNMESVGYRNGAVRYVKGDVLVTLRVAANIPKKLSVLRLDTDWYESTRTELEVLYPRVTTNGVVLIDDYGHWLGSRKATDEFISRTQPPVYLCRTDTTGIEFVKPRASLTQRILQIVR